MGDFAQNGFVTTLHNFGTKSLQQFEEELKIFSGYRPMELILPSLYSELEGPALRHIVEQISQVDYISHVIIGLDKADKEQFLHASHFFSKLNKPFSLLWNDGPRLRKIDAYTTPSVSSPFHPQTTATNHSTAVAPPPLY